jgi:hypothetical protein
VLIVSFPLVGRESVKLVKDDDLWADDDDAKCCADESESFFVYFNSFVGGIYFLHKNVNFCACNFNLKNFNFLFTFSRLLIPLTIIMRIARAT